MTDVANHLASREMKDVVGFDPSPPPYTWEGEQPPPYSASPDTHFPANTETSHPAAEPASLDDLLGPESSSDMTSLMDSAFDDKTVRMAFVRKVFCILTLQLLFTCGVVCVFTFSSVVKTWVQTNLWAYLSSYIIFMVVGIGLVICRSFSRGHPWNLVGLVAVTVGLSYMVGTIASFHNTMSVVIAMGATLAVCLAIITFSVQTRFDFTLWIGVLLVVFVDLVVFGVFCTFYYSHILEIVYGCVGALLYSLILAVDCQLLMGTKTYRLNPEEYVNAALLIYIDIMYIFLYLLGRRCLSSYFCFKWQ
ncbi:protein lifeguard 1 [Polymixia lowei]